MDITLELIDMMASPEVVARGRAYFHQGRVYLDQVTETYVRAFVEGAQEYTVELAQDRNGYTTSCNCPYSSGDVCKHIVAAMLATMYHQAKLLPLTGAPTRRPARKKREASWVEQVRSILPERVPTLPATSLQKPWRLAYGLIIAGRERCLYPLRIKLKQDGSDGAASVLKQYDLYDGLHFDITDRLLLPRMPYGLRITMYDSGFTDEYVLRGYGYRGVVRSSDRVMADVLEMLVEKELYLEHAGRLQGKRLHVLRERAELRLEIDEVEGSLRVQPLIAMEGADIPLPPNMVAITYDPLWVLVEDRVFRLEGVTSVELVALQSAKMPFIVPERGRDEFLEEVFPRLATRYKVRSRAPILKTIDTEPRPRLYLKEVDEKLAVELRFLYETVEVPEYDPSGFGQRSGLVRVDSDDASLQHVLRKHAAEEAFSKHLFDSSLSAVLHPTAGILYLPTIHPLEWLVTVLPKLRDAGYEVFGQEDLKKHRLRYGRGTIGVRVSSGIDWFDVSVNLGFEGAEAEYEAFVRAVKNNERFVKLDDGSFGMVPEEWMKKFRRLLAVGGSAEKGVKLSRAHLGMIDELLSDADKVDSDALFNELRERFRRFTTIQHQALPVHFHGELRPYQKAGYDWLHFLREFGVGGILADDMGLGKTVQALALLQKVYEDGEKLPSLIVVPASPLFNWEKEIQRFTPNLRTLVYSGLGRKQRRPQFSHYNIILTSYGILRRDIDVLKEQDFSYVILDESQNIKNALSVNAQAARALKARHKLALTGTPVENTLNELWSQFAFLNPGMLGSARSFTENFAKPIERYQDASASAALKHLIFPFILRRTKELVAQELPPKVESTVYCDMEAEQKRLYEYWRRYYREEIMKSIDTVGFQRSKFKVLEGLMRLRQVCCHPRLVDVQYTGTAGKFEAFVEMLEDILAEGHKVLVFSQFVKMLSLLREHCDRNNIVYEYLDGRTVDRKARVERFQSDENVKLFLISLKAGGTGVNLTAADYVIHYDPWWNPAVEMQATDRTHRIGQMKQVFAYKLITRESVEEKILALQEKKQALVKSIITTDSGFMKSLTKEDVEALFG